MTDRGIILNIEIGLINELYKQETITEIQKNKAIQLLKTEYIKEANTNERKEKK